MKVLTLITVGMLAAVSLSAETIKYDLNQFKKMRNATVADGTLTINEHTTLQFNQLNFDPKAKYTFTFDYKTVPNKKSAILYAGFFCYDKNGKQIFHHNVTHVPKSFTTLTKAVKAGDKTVAIKDGSKWRKGTFIAFNAKANFSDLPNFEVYGYIQKAEKKGNEWILTLSNPVRKAYPAGTAIRNHRPGGYVYTNHGVPAAAWKTCKGSKQGVNKLGHDNTITNFWPGTVKIRPIILTNWNYRLKGTATQFRNLTLTVTK